MKNIWRMHTYEDFTYAHTYIHTHTRTYIRVIHVWDVNSSYVQHDSFDFSRLHRTYSTQYTHNTHTLPLSPPFSAPADYIGLTARTCSPMGRLWLVGSLKTWVSFAKEPYKRDYILQKRPIIFKERTNHSHPIQGLIARTCSAMGWLRIVGSLKT